MKPTFWGFWASASGATPAAASAPALLIQSRRFQMACDLDAHSCWADAVPLALDRLLRRLVFWPVYKQVTGQTWSAAVHQAVGHSAGGRGQGGSAGGSAGGAAARRTGRVQPASRRHRRGGFCTPEVRRRSEILSARPSSPFLFSRSPLDETC